MSKVAIIGAGIIGVCCAHFLQKSGYQVTIFDQNEPGTQTSFGNAGLFASHECVVANSPSLWQNIPGMLFNQDNSIVIDWIYILKHLPWALKFLKNCTTKKTEYIAESLSSFSRHSVLAYDEIFNVVNVSNNIVNKRPIFLYESKELFEKNQYSLKLRKKFNVEFDIMSQEEIAKIEPHLEPIYYNGIVLKGERFTKSPLEITQKIFNYFIEKRGVFVKSRVKSIYKKNKSIFLKYNNEEEYFDKIVVAAGAWSNLLAKSIGDNFPLEVERGYHIMFESNKNLINHPIGWAKKNFYITPMEDGIRAAGTVEIAGFKKPINQNMIKLIEDTARKILPKLGKVKSHWMGFRPTLPDSLPVIGESKKCKNVYYAFGHQHLGLSLAAVTGKVVQSLVDKNPSNIDICPLNPCRF